MDKYKAIGLPWHIGTAVNVTGCNTSSEVIQKAKLDWQVKKCELVAKMPFSIHGNNELTEIDEINGNFAKDGNIFRYLPDVYATYRTDYNIPLGFVKSKYEVVQNIEAFNFFDEAIGSDSCHWESAGYLGYGYKVFVTAKIAFTTNVDVNGHKDNIENYLVFSNSHDGSSSITIMFTPIRVACTNMLNTGLNAAESYIRIRHTEQANQKLHEGLKILEVAARKACSASELYNALAVAKMSDEEVLNYLTGLVLNDKEYALLFDYDPDFGNKRLINKEYTVLEKTGISTRKANTISKLYDYYFDGVEQNKIVGTAWGAYNAVTGYFANAANLEDSKRMESMLYGTAFNTMNKAINRAYKLIKST